MTNQTLQMTSALQEYISRYGMRESPPARALREYTLHHITEHNMQIAPEQGAFMALLIKMLNAKNIIEIGTFTGYSALVMAEALSEEGSIITCDISDHWTSIAQKFWQQAHVAHKIDLRCQPAQISLDQLIATDNRNNFDFVFIDANKEQYDAYYEQCLQLLRAGGVIAFDNTLWNGSVATDTMESNDEITSILHALNQKLHADERVDMCLLPIADGLTLVYKK